jgi:dipeptidyl aminopeptidase/acylaminoacyl peptidase
MLRKIFRVTILFVLLINLSITPQDNVFTSFDLQRLRYAKEISISPDGKYIAYTVLTPRPLTDGPGKHYEYLFIYDLEESKSYGVVGNKVNVKSIGWTADSKHITFLAMLGTDRYTQIYQVQIDGGDPRKITNSLTSVIKYQLSSNGYDLAYTCKEVIDEKKKELLEKGFDAEIFEEECRDRTLYLLNLKSASMAARKLTTGVTVFDFKWSSDGKMIAAFIADKNLVDYSYMFKRVYLIDPTTGERKLHLDNPGKIDEMAWSPNSKHIAFIASSGLNDAVAGSLFLTEVPNNKIFEELRNYAENFEGSIREVAWKDSNTVLFMAEEGVDISLNEQKIGGKERRILIKPGKVVFDKFIVHEDLLSFAGNTAEHPNELFTFTLIDNKLSKLTDLNPWLANIKFGKQEKITYKAKDGLEITGILFYPVDYDELKKYPLIVHIHGGPESMRTNGWQTYYNRWGQIACGQGFFLFMPNYRSSSGRGVDYTMEGFGKLVGKEFTDVIDGIDYLIAQRLVDKDRVGIGGGSYGGYFSAWGATKFTDRFAAAVIFVAVTDQVSKMLTTDIPYEDYYVHWGIWIHENEDLIWERSPVRYAKDSKTAALVLGGTKDTRVHPSQSLEIYRALKLHSNAPVRFVRYPGEKHGNKKNTSRLDYNLRTMRWFDYYLKSENPKDEMPDKYLNIEN